MATVTPIEPGDGRVVLVVIAHADDAVLFLGGTIACWSGAGWRVVVARITDDRWDSFGMSVDDTIAANAAELHRSAQLLGVAEIVELGRPTDTLGDAHHGDLREAMVRLVRRHRPHTLVTFDPFSGVGEDNQDHLAIARAVDEAFWTAQFDHHHPEHLEEGLALHGVAERWYFGRPVHHVTDVVNIGATLELKITAALAHRTPLRNLAHQLRLQAATAGYDVPIIDAAVDGDLEPLVRPLLTDAAARAGAPHGLTAAEEFRVVRLGGLSEFVRTHGTRRRR